MNRQIIITDTMAARTHHKDPIQFAVDLFKEQHDLTFTTKEIETDPRFRFEIKEDQTEFKITFTGDKQ